MINVLTLYWSARTLRSCLDGDERYQRACKILCGAAPHHSRRATPCFVVCVRVLAAAQAGVTARPMKMRCNQSSKRLSMSALKLPKARP